MVVVDASELCFVAARQGYRRKLVESFFWTSDLSQYLVAAVQGPIQISAGEKARGGIQEASLPHFV